MFLILPLKASKSLIRGEINPIFVGLGTVGRPGNIVIWFSKGRTVEYNKFKWFNISSNNCCVSSPFNAGLFANLLSFLTKPK